MQLNYVISPLLPLHRLSLKAQTFVLNLNQINSNFCKTCALNFCKISGDFTNFSVEMWIFFVSSPLALVVKLNKFTA